MRFKIKKRPRQFKVGMYSKITLKDMGDIFLSDNEQVTFVTKNKNRYDVCKNNWGFYATPSINSRLKKEGFKTAIVKNKLNRYFLMIVEKKKFLAFKKYCKKEKQTIVKWLHNGFN